MGKGKPFPAVVEQVASGHVLRLTSLQDFTYVTVMVCGVQAPSLGRRPAPGPPPTSNGAADSAATAVASAPEAAPEPFSREAKHFSESKALNRLASGPVMLNGWSQVPSCTACQAHTPEQRNRQSEYRLLVHHVLALCAKMGACVQGHAQLLYFLENAVPL